MIPDAWTHLARVLGGAAPVADSAPTDASLGDIHLLPHQRDAARRLTERLRTDGVALLADATGLGKTYTACAVADHLGRPPMLVVAPAALRETWHRALARTGLVAQVISHEALSLGASPEAPAALVVVDEAHHARSPRTARWQALARACRGARVLCLSATPVHNTPRDLAALFALAWGEAARYAPMERLLANVVRRTSADGARLPAVASWTWHAVPGDARVADAILALPPPLPPSDGGVAETLWRFGLLRAWASSGAALDAMLARRVARGVALEHALADGRHLSRAALARWAWGTDVQPELPFGTARDAPEAPGPTSALRRRLSAHLAALQALRPLARSDPGDAARVAELRRLMAAHEPLVAFTCFDATARGYWRALRGVSGIALATGRGGRIASGTCSREELFAAMHRDAWARRPPHLRLRLLVATDVASEGLDLDAAACVLHLDLPWTPARVAQRVGRVVRLASRHAAVAVHAFAPPAASADVPVLATLARKAGDARAVGTDALWAPAWQAHEAPAAPEALEQLRTLAAQAMAAAPRRPPPAPPRRGALAVTVLQGPHPGIVAVFENPGAPVRVHPARAELLPLVQAAQWLASARPWPARAAPPRAAVHRARRLARRWEAEQHAATVSGTTGWDAPAATAMLRRVSHELRRAPRAERVARAALGAALRLRLDAPVAAADEAVLSALTQSPQRGAAWWDAVAAWVALPRRPAGTPAASGRAVAVFVLVAPDTGR